MKVDNSAMDGPKISPAEKGKRLGVGLASIPRKNILLQKHQR